MSRFWRREAHRLLLSSGRVSTNRLGTMKRSRRLSTGLGHQRRTVLGVQLANPEVTFNETG
jgi:hypothetical protein